MCDEVKLFLVNEQRHGYIPIHTSTQELQIGN